LRFQRARRLQINALEAKMQTARRSEVDGVSDRDLEELNRQMLRATWEAGLPTAAGVADALAQLPPMPKQQARLTIRAAR
jgi:hypothetical protein